jgi:hypothetical protein
MPLQEVLQKFLTMSPSRRGLGPAGGRRIVVGRKSAAIRLSRRTQGSRVDACERRGQSIIELIKLVYK